jgi:PII-like signaling protein
MNSSEVTMVRIYLTEGDHQLRRLLDFLHKQERVWGVTAFRGIAGFGKSGKAHESCLLDVSLDLPLVIEFFDHPDKAARILEDLDRIVEPGHVVSWPARVNKGE